MIFDERNIFLSNRYNYPGTGVPVEIELVPGFGLPPSPHLECHFSTLKTRSII